MIDVNNSKTELCKFRGNVRMLLNGGDKPVVVQLKKAEILDTFLPPSSQANILDIQMYQDGFEKKHFRDKLGMSYNS